MFFGHYALAYCISTFYYTCNSNTSTVSEPESQKQNPAQNLDNRKDNNNNKTITFFTYPQISNKIPIFWFYIATAVIDYANGICLMLDLSQSRPDITLGPYLYQELTNIGWDHSLLSAIVMSIVFGGISMIIYNQFYRINDVTEKMNNDQNNSIKKTENDNSNHPTDTNHLTKFHENTNESIPVFLFITTTSFSHWIADLIVHNNDLPLYPGSTITFGWGLWSKWGVFSWIFEIVFSIILVMVGFYNLFFSQFKKTSQNFKKKQMSNSHKKIFLTHGIIISLILPIISSPYLTPTKYIALHPEYHSNLGSGVGVIVSYIIPLIFFYYSHSYISKNANKDKALMASGTKMD